MSTPLFGNVIEDNDQTRARLSHLEEIKALVGNPYPNKFQRTNLAGSAEGEDTITALAAHETIKKIVGDESFAEAFTLLMSKVKAGARPAAEELEPVNAKLNDINVRVSGRLATPPRVMGKVAFVHLSDGKERLQIYVRRQEAKAVNNDTGREVEEVESGWKLFGLLDHGDFVGVEGKLFVTKTGELSVHVRELQFLSKALVPMPDKMHGISDPEIRQRQRYADLIASSLKVEAADAQGEGEAAPRELTTREVFERRSALIREMRRYLDEHSYIEVETPMLSPIASGAAARPFETFHKALGIPLYLRIAPELYLKRLLVGGFERVYELNRNFRNEGISTRHNPEFTMLEFYTAYKDVNWMMDFCEEMLRRVVSKIMGDPIGQLGNEKIDLSQPFERLTIKQAIVKYWPQQFRRMTRGEFNESWLDDPDYLCYLTAFLNWYPRLEAYAFLPDILVGNIAGIDRFVNIASEHPEIVERLTAEELIRQINRAAEKIPPEQVVRMFKHEHGKSFDDNREAWLVYTFERTYDIFREWVRPVLSQPTFITDFPKAISPLSKASPDNPAIAERFELYVAGMEVANGFSELNDPAEQLERFEDQARQRERGDDEAMQMDLDYVRALSYGMPPAAGIGIGIDRLTMLLTNRRSIRDVILFPHMRPRQSADEQSSEADEAEEGSSEP